MGILSFSSEHEAGAAVVSEGKILAAVNEERFTRVKNQAGFPHNSLKAVLDIAGMSPDDIEHVIIPEISKTADFFTNVIPYFPVNIFARDGAPFPGIEEALKHFLLSSFLVTRTYLKVGLKHQRDQQRLKRMFRRAKFHRVEHHVAHAASAFFTSYFDRALIISADYWGDFAAVMVSIGEGRKIKVISRSYFPHSPGHYYASVTKWLGFKANRHEGKIVGLAAYGDPRSPAYEEIKDIFICDGLTIKAPYMIGRMWHPRAPFFKDNLMNRLKKKYTREDIAAVFQRKFEEAFTDLARNCVQKFGIQNILLVGGSFANVKLNQRIFEIDGVKNIYIFPNMSDGGIASGAALYYDIKENGSTRNMLDNVYLGPEYSAKEIEQALQRNNIEYSYYANIEEKIAQLLAEGHVVARFNGRMEYGPRALGNRSILYQATDPSVNDWLNKKLKRTEFMPFAPVTLQEFAAKCYKNLHGAEYPAKFMTITFDCTDYMRETAPATVHVDGTARPQLISGQDNPGYYKILKEYYRITGLPSIINTSFNMHEEPIVCTPEDAIRAFNQGHLEYLAIGNFLAQYKSERKIRVEHAQNSITTTG